jgi:hypothetical protein
MTAEGHLRWLPSRSWIGIPTFTTKVNLASVSPSCSRSALVFRHRIAGLRRLTRTGCSRRYGKLRDLPGRLAPARRARPQASAVGRGQEAGADAAVTAVGEWATARGHGSAAGGAAPAPAVAPGTPGATSTTRAGAPDRVGSGNAADGAHRPLLLWCDGAPRKAYSAVRAKLTEKDRWPVMRGDNGGTSRASKLRNIWLPCCAGPASRPLS